MQMTGTEPEKQYPSVLNYLSVLIRWRGFIIGTVLVSSLMMAAYSLIMPKTFESKAVLVPTRESSSLSPLEAISGSLLGLGLGRGSTEIFLLKAILDSRTLRENIVRDFHLEEVYDAENMDRAVQSLAGHITVTLTQDNTLELSFDHKTSWLSFNKTDEESTRRFVQQVALGIVQQLDLLNRRYQGQEARNYRQFIEERREEIGQDLAALEDSLTRYQEKHEVTIVDAQLLATFEAAAILEAEVVKRELEYAMAETKLGPDSPKIKSLHAELQAAKSAFENSFGGKDGERRFLFGYDRDLPLLMKEYLRLYRDIKIQSEIFSFITSKYEESKLREAQDIPTINILDYPDVPDIRSAPRRAFLVITTGVLMTIFTVIMAFVLNFFHRVKVSFPEQYHEITRWKKLQS